jgi:hypothetical protein
VLRHTLNEEAVMVGYFILQVEACICYQVNFVRRNCANPIKNKAIYELELAPFICLEEPTQPPQSSPNRVSQTPRQQLL